MQRYTSSVTLLLVHATPSSESATPNVAVVRAACADQAAGSAHETSTEESIVPAVCTASLGGPPSGVNRQSILPEFVNVPPVSTTDAVPYGTAGGETAATWYVTVLEQT